MTDDQITALVREYAEEYTKKKYPNAPGHIQERIVEGRLEHMEDFIPWLLRRFCLVKKSKIREAYKDAQKDQHNSEGDFALTLAGRNRSAVLIDLFPEIVKEVEE